MNRFEVHPNIVVKYIEGDWLICDYESDDIYVGFGFDTESEAQKWCDVFNRWCKI